MSNKSVEDFIKSVHVTLDILDGYFLKDKDSTVTGKYLDSLFDADERLDGVDRNTLYNIIKLHFAVKDQGGKPLLIKGLKQKYDTIEDKEYDDQITDAAGLWASVFLVKAEDGILYLTDIKKSLALYGLDTDDVYAKVSGVFTDAVGNMFEEVLGEAGEVVGFKGVKLQPTFK